MERRVKLSQAGGDKCLGQLICLGKSLSYKLHTKARFLVTVGGLGRLHPHFRFLRSFCKKVQM